MKNGRKKWIAFITAGLLGILVAFAANCSFDLLKVQGDSMEPSVKNGNTVLVNKLTYFFRQPEIGDVVTLPCDVYGEDGEGGMLVRRIAATEGDRVEIKDGMLYVNGKLRSNNTEAPVYMDAMEEITVKSGCVFVLSDNRSAALDSRDAAVDQPEIRELMGKVCFK